MQTSVNWDLLAKHAAGETTAAEAQQVQVWLQASEANVMEFRMVQQLMQTAETAEPFTDFAPNVDFAWNKVSQRIAVENPEKTGHVISFTNWVYKVAAVLVVGLAISFFVFKASDNNSNVTQQLALTEQATSDETTKVILPDGSEVWLNRNSSLRYPEAFAANSREVYLEGEAFFKVIRNTKQPFRIHAHQSVTEVLGTSFNVSAYPQQPEVKVTVVTGKVSLADEKEPALQVILTPGEQGSYNPETKQVEEQPNPDLNFMAWQTGILTFKGDNLAQVSRVLETHYNTRISFGNNKLRSCRFTATLDNQPLTEVLEIIKLTLDLDYETENGQVTLSGTGCSDS